ncbi:glycosyltransferase family 4 protein [Bacillus mycoides]|uniref:glycosyltransferase family 4 protein n=1 Tax=Bacillus mycoides TaxID=1405 RepID=UPI001C039BDA|nr:glycosyltransferase family 4 protein [Bacillus mycoides]MCQ6535942.1 glycosyltransferase family 4 protein [Bacillus mycoides]QWH53987.1 glycosyltransferase [Bacillus mycoides]QWI14193.1 glycosyltransferase [Bacillus mycoides]QWI57826.1 glycosyltransferase [Bacillus mycoides]QWI92830.1 glycosyltransferase family 4 protein [Bacillus mycoides]
MKKILVLNHFPTVYPPISGGTLRYFHIYNELSKYFDITLLSQSSERKGGLFQYTSTFKEYKVQKNNLHNSIMKKTKISQIKSLYERSLILHIEFSKYPSMYKKYFEELYNNNDIIIHESPYLLGYDQYFSVDNKPRIYNSHNHEYVLAKQIWHDKTAIDYLPCIYELEKKLVTYTNLIFTTSQQEKDNMIAMYNINPIKVKLAPNGVSPSQWKVGKKTLKNQLVALFIGSEYFPNVEAVKFIIHHLVDECPNIEFMIVGGCCNPFLHIKKPNLTLLGRIPHKQKLNLFLHADIAINPMFLGAGVNLKTIEYLSAGLPLFSTDYGIRGLNLKENEHYIRVNKDDFPKKLNFYCNNLLYLKKIALQGQRYININYSWESITKNIVKEINHLNI